MNNLSLYQLSGNYLQALDFLSDPETDLPAEVINDTLEALGGELEDKAVNVAKFLRNMEAMSEAIKAAEVSMEKRRKALEARVKWMKAYLKDNMERTGISKIECPYFKLSIQKNPAAVNVINEDVIPEQFKEQVITWKTRQNRDQESHRKRPGRTWGELVNGTRLSIK